MGEHMTKPVTGHKLENVTGGNKILQLEEIHAGKNFKKDIMNDIYG